MRTDGSVLHAISQLEQAVRYNDRLAAKTATFVLAGGAGRRLNPLTRYRPKPLVPFGGCFRILDFTLSNCFNSGVERAYVLTQHERESMAAYLRKGWTRRGPAHAEFAIPQPPAAGKRYAGTADAVLQNLGLVQGQCEYVLVVSADHIYAMNYGDVIDFHASSGADATIATIDHPAELSSEMGVLEVDEDGRVTAFQEKPRHSQSNSNKLRSRVNMGVYVFNVEAFRRAIEGNDGPLIDIACDLIPCLLRSNKVNAYRHADGSGVPRYWRDVGTLQAYYEASMDLLVDSPDLDPYNEQWPIGSAGRVRLSGRSALSSVGSEIEVSSIIPSAASIEGACVYNCVLSPGVVLESGVDVRHSVLLPGAVLKRGARVRRAIIDAHVVVESGDRIGYDRQKDASRFHTLPNGTVVVSLDHVSAEGPERRERVRVV
jgi:glucose-1-phosphate adenylyltransferase